jgi:ABC-type multidrug transport system fused ATPase/permease subunit
MLARQQFDLLSVYLGPQRGRALLLSLLLLGGMALELASPQVIRFFLDTAQAGGALRLLTAAAAVFIAVSLVQRGVGLWSNYLAQTVGWAATNALRRDLTRHCLGLDIPFHKQHTPGEMIERIDGDVTALGNFFSAFAARVLGNALLVAGILVMLYRENAYVGLGLTLYTALTLLVLRVIQPVAVARWTASRAASADLFGFIEERISGAEEIRAAGAEAHTLRRLYSLLRRQLEAFRASIMVDTLIYNVTSALSVLGYAAGLGLGVYLYTRGQATIGTAYLIVAYVGMLATPLQNLRGQLEDLQHALASIGRVGELFAMQSRLAQTPNEPTESSASPSGGHHLSLAKGALRQAQRPRARPADDRPEPAILPAGPLATAFEGVTFGYEDGGPLTADRGLTTDDPELTTDDRRLTTDDQQLTTDDQQLTTVVLRDVSFRLPAGRVLGVLGRTGSGKTTLTRLLSRLYDADAGRVRIGDADIRAIPQAELRGRVAMVTQDVQLFEGTVRENLTFFAAREADREIERALRELRLWDWVRGLSQGLDTRLTGGGAGLSAGEAQLLAFARAFLKNPGLVILDEASSRLDPATETLLEGAIDRLLEGRTAVIIAHRLRTVQRADDILILEGGRVVEYGRRAQLATDPASRFSGLLAAGLEEMLV